MMLLLYCISRKYAKTFTIFSKLRTILKNNIKLGEVQIFDGYVCYTVYWFVCFSCFFVSQSVFSVSESITSAVKKLKCGLHCDSVVFLQNPLLLSTIKISDYWFEWRNIAKDYMEIYHKIIIPLELFCCNKLDKVFSRYLTV